MKTYLFAIIFLVNIKSYSQIEITTNPYSTEEKAKFSLSFPKCLTLSMKDLENYQTSNKPNRELLGLDWGYFKLTDVIKEVNNSFCYANTKFGYKTLFPNEPAESFSVDRANFSAWSCYSQKEKKDYYTILNNKTIIIEITPARRIELIKALNNSDYKYEDSQLEGYLYKNAKYSIRIINILETSAMIVNPL